MTGLNPPIGPPSAELSTEAVEAALRGETDNPIFPVLQQHVETMRIHNPDTTDGRDALVVDLAEASPYELDIRTLIATWALGVEKPEKSGMSRSFSVPLITMHVLHDPSQAEPAVVAREFINSDLIDHLPSLEGLKDREGARTRVEHLFGELGLLTTYLNGAPDVMTVVGELSKSDDPKDKARLEELLKQTKKRYLPILGAVKENVTNASLVLSMMLHERS
jgi:hypothetical protein